MYISNTVHIKIRVGKLTIHLMHMIRMQTLQTWPSSFCPSMFEHMALNWSPGRAVGLTERLFNPWLSIYLNPTSWRQALSPTSLSRPDLHSHKHTHRHTHIETQTHTCKVLTFMQEMEIRQADTRAWTKCQTQATGREKEPVLIMALTIHYISPVKWAVQDICRWQFIFIISSRDKPRRNVLSIGNLRSLRTMMNFF